LELLKVIVNDALGSKGVGGPFPREYFGKGFDQLEYMLTLCALFFVILIINGGITMLLFIFKSITSERLLCRLRCTLFERIHRFPAKHFQKTSQGELTSMIAAEVEPLSQFFADAAASQLKLIAFACDRISFTSGEEIFRQGDDADAAFVVLDVRVDTYVEAGEQEVQVSQTVEGNQLIGEMALLSTRPRAVTAKATTAATLLGLEKDMFLQLVDGDLEFTGRISRILSDRIYGMTERMQEVA